MPTALVLSFLQQLLLLTLQWEIMQLPALCSRQGCIYNGLSRKSKNCTPKEEVLLRHEQSSCVDSWENSLGKRAQDCAWNEHHSRTDMNVVSVARWSWKCSEIILPVQLSISSFCKCPVTHLRFCLGRIWRVILPGVPFCVVAAFFIAWHETFENHCTCVFCFIAAALIYNRSKISFKIGNKPNLPDFGSKSQIFLSMFICVSKITQPKCLVSTEHIQDMRWCVHT